MSPEPEPQVTDLREFFAVIRRRKWSIALVTLLVTGLALGLVYRRTPTYAATADVSVQPLSAGADLQGFYADAFVNMDTESRLVTSSDAILAGAAADPALALNPESQEDLDALSAKLSVSIPANTTILSITCTDPSAEFAKDCADAVANAYISDRVKGAQASYDDAKKTPLAQIEATTKQIRELTASLAAAPEDQKPSIQSQIDSANNLLFAAQTQLANVPAPNPTAAKLALPARLPAVPSNKDYITTGILAAILGLALGIGLAFIRERMDERIAGRESLEDALDAPVMAVVPQITSWRNKKETRVVTMSAPDTAPAEAYKTARTTLLYIAREERMQVVEVTGPSQSEGKTTTTVNLAVAMAQSGRSVVAVSCDLRKPRLHRFFKLGNEVGLSTVLAGVGTVEDVTKHTDMPNLCVIASGPVPDNPGEMLGSDMMARVLDELRTRFDVILLDTPPALVVSDAVALAPYTDGVVVVADASKTTRAAILHLRHQFERAGGRVIGGVLNKLDAKHAKRYPNYYRSYYAGGHHYREQPPATGKTRGRRNRRKTDAPMVQDMPPMPPLQEPGPDTWP